VSADSRRGQDEVVEASLFDEVADALLGMIPAKLGPFHQRARRYGIKVWFGPQAPQREHYEAQVIGADADDAATVLALEVGFHTEYPQLSDNENVIAHLLGREKRWRAKVGKEAVAGPFLGRAELWRRVSETWPDPDLGDAELAVAIAARLVDYDTAIARVRRDR
jgi:hypothetical protein